MLWNILPLLFSFILSEATDTSQIMWIIQVVGNMWYTEHLILQSLCYIILKLVKYFWTDCFSVKKCPLKLKLCGNTLILIKWKRSMFWLSLKENILYFFIWTPVCLFQMPLKCVLYYELDKISESQNWNEFELIKMEHSDWLNGNLGWNIHLTNSLLKETVGTSTRVLSHFS